MKLLWYGHIHRYTRARLFKQRLRLKIVSNCFFPAWVWLFQLLGHKSDLCESDFCEYDSKWVWVSVFSCSKLKKSFSYESNFCESNFFFTIQQWLGLKNRVVRNRRVWVFSRVFQLNCKSPRRWLKVATHRIYLAEIFFSNCFPVVEKFPIFFHYFCEFSSNGKFY